MKIFKINILLLIFCLATINAQKIEEVNSDIVFKAMEDELQRNMQELKMEGSSAPFYIDYILRVGERARFSATLGAIVDRDVTPLAACFAGVKLGDYSLTDEKFSDKVNRSPRHNDGHYSLPLDLNYNGIRRSLWMATNNVYKNTVEVYKNKTELMKKQGIEVADLPSPDFSKEEPGVSIEDYLEREINNEELADFVREISGEFKNYSDIIKSDVDISAQNMLYHKINSEGTKLKKPFRFYILNVSATVLNNKNQPISQKLEYYHNSFKEMPSVDEIKADVEKFVENLIACKNAKSFTEVYNGPILFEGTACTELCYAPLFTRGKGLVANPRSLENRPKEGLIRARFKSWEDYKEKKVVDRKLSIELTPFVKEYNGVSLIGNMNVDMDGLTPKASEVLVEEGILKKQIVDRIPTGSQHNSLAHRKLYVENQNVRERNGPSVVKITSTETLSYDELKEEMVKAAKEEDLEHVFIIKPLNTNANYNPFNYYKVNVEDGTEELVMGVEFKFTDKSLKKIKGLSNKELVQNTLVPDYFAIDNQMKRYKGAPPEFMEYIKKHRIGIQGVAASFISPDALLLESVELSGQKGKIKAVSRLVDNPLSVN